ncbi:hypothetical protein IKW72_07380 [bacterium]|nr:hypothetical protein [bacterium]
MENFEKNKVKEIDAKRDTVKFIAVLGCVAMGIGLMLLLANYWQSILSSKWFLLCCGIALHGLALAPSTKKIFKAFPEILAAMGTTLIGFALWHLLPSLWDDDTKIGCILVFSLIVGFIRNYKLHDVLSYALVMALFIKGLIGDNFHTSFYYLGIFLVMGVFSINAYLRKSVVSFAAALATLGMAQFIFGNILPFRPLQLSLNALVFWGLACSPQIREFNEKFSKTAYVIAFLETSVVLYILAFEDTWELDWFNNHLSLAVFKKNIPYSVFTSIFYILELAVTAYAFIFFWKTGPKARAKITFLIPLTITVIFLLCNIGTGTKVGDALYLLPESFYSNLFFLIWFVYLFFNVWVSFKESRLLLRVFGLVFIVIGGIARIIVENSLEEITTAFCFIYAGMVLLFTAYCAFKVVSDEEEKLAEEEEKKYAENFKFNSALNEGGAHDEVQ